jgi:hypothetical protein
MVAILMGLLLILLVVATAWRLARSFRSLTAFVIAGFFFVWAEVVLIGFALSALHLLNSTFAWISGAALGVVLTALLSKSRRPATTLNVGRIREIALAEWRAISSWQKVVLGVLAAATVIVIAINFAMAAAVAPSCWDTLTYHLPRVAYFLQFGSLDYFPANYVYQVAHAKDGSLLLIFAFLGSGRHENGMQLVQFAAWCVGAPSVYGLARNAGSSRFASIVCGLLFMLLTECVMEAATCQNDLLVAVCGAGAAYFVLELRNSKNIWLAGLPIGLGLGTKLSFLPLFASLFVILFTIPGPRIEWIRRVFVLLVGTVASLVLFSLPAGYAANFRHYGSPVGPPEMVALDSNVNCSVSNLIKIGGMNLVRFGFEFFSLDGLPNAEPVRAVQRWMRAGPAALADRLIGPRLTRPDTALLPAFELERLPTTNENSSTWGPFGFLLIWPSVLLVVCRRIGTRKEAVLAGAAIAFACVFALIHPYDPWIGRMFLSAAPFACAAAGSAITSGLRARYLRYWIVVVMAIGSLTAVCAALFRSGRPIFPFREKPSIFALDRLSQMTVRHKAYRQAIHRFDAMIPRNATVAVLLPGDSYEFPLFGEGLTRRLLPAAIEWRERGTIPEAARYLLFSNQILAPDPTDISLGEDWYLRVRKNEKAN